MLDHMFIGRRALRFALFALSSGAAAGAGAQPSARQAPHTTISGVVFDSARGQAIGGAIVQLVHVEHPAIDPRTAIADSFGAFVFDSVPAGSYYASFLHPVLDALNLTAPIYLVKIRDPQPVDFMMSIPSSSTLRGHYCGARAVSDSTGVIIGRVLRSRPARPVAGARVTVRWVESYEGVRGRFEEVRQAGARSDPTGWFAICGVPVGTGAAITIMDEGDSTAFQPITIPASGIGLRDFDLDGAAAPAVRPVTPVRRPARSETPSSGAP